MVVKRPGQIKAVNLGGDFEAVLRISRHDKPEIHFTHGGLHIATLKHTPKNREMWAVHDGTLRLPDGSVIRKGEHKVSPHWEREVVHRLRIGTPSANLMAEGRVHKAGELPWHFVVAEGPITKHNDDNKRDGNVSREFGIQSFVAPAGTKGVDRMARIGDHRRGYVWEPV